ncbi:MAG: pantoate kinase [archaeon]
MKVRAYCPGHISTIFRVCMHDDPLDSGSRGAGIVIDEGVVTEVETVPGSGSLVYFNGNMMDFAPSFAVLKRMAPDSHGKVIFRHTTKMPLGAGFGVSGACAVGAGLCLNEIYSLGMSLGEVGGVAHAAEIECATGLGDVSPMLVGGIEMRKREGAPGRSLIENIKSDAVHLICFSFGAVDTKKVISGEGYVELNRIADVILEKLFFDPTFDNFMACSIEFAGKAGFLTERLRRVLLRLNAIPGCRASQTMLGESGFVFLLDDMNKNVLRELNDANYVFETKVGYRKPGLIL